MDWQACIKQKIAKGVKVDKNLITSLMRSADKKFKTGHSIILTDESATSKVSLLYESLRELLEALAISQGYKIYNHECYCPFLKEILHKSTLADSFNQFRKLRNDVNYYGEDITAEEAKIILHETNELIGHIKVLLTELHYGL